MGGELSSDRERGTESLEDGRLKGLGQNFFPILVAVLNWTHSVGRFGRFACLCFFVCLWRSFSQRTYIESFCCLKMQNYWFFFWIFCFLFVFWVIRQLLWENVGIFQGWRILVSVSGDIDTDTDIDIFHSVSVSPNPDILRSLKNFVGKCSHCEILVRVL